MVGEGYMYGVLMMASFKQGRLLATACCVLRDGHINHDI